jgi:hypothetical protein
MRSEGDSMSRKPMTRDELARKVEWEGGPLGALEFGIVFDDITDPVLRDLWKDLQDRYRALTPLVRDIERRLRTAA